MTFLLLQVRAAGDPMRDQEVACFARRLDAPAPSIRAFVLLEGVPDDALLSDCRAVLIGGSGDYSAAGTGAWLAPVFGLLRELAAAGKPTFASCWGFQAFARALGGTCEHCLDRAELGTIDLDLTPSGATDPLFSSLPARFAAVAGHEDCVTRLPAEAVPLATSTRNAHQAFRLGEAPIWCTQFHPELDQHDLCGRLQTYPRYVRKIVGISLDELMAQCRETPEANALLRRFNALI